MAARVETDVFGGRILSGVSGPPLIVPNEGPGPGASLSADIKHPRDLTQDEIAGWRAFQQLSPWLDSPFFSPEFTCAVGAARSDTRVAVLHAGGKRAGFFPFHATGRGIGKPVGGTFSDYQGPILAPGIRVTASNLLLACRLRAYDFNHCPAQLEPLASGGFVQSTSPRIRFDDGYEAYLAGCTSSLRDAVRNTERRGRKIEREVGEVVYTFDDRREECWDWLVETKTRALAKEGTQAGFELPWIKQLHAELRRAHAPEFSGLMSTLACDGRLIAAHFGMRRGPVLCWWHTTFDETYRQYGPGLMLLLSTIREGAARGLTVIDLGRGNQHYKMVFSNDQYDLCEGAIARTGTVAAVLRAGHKLVSKASERLPLGSYESIPRRATGRMVSNVRLP